VFIVRRADELSTAAANALLKTLEEPRSGTYFILLTSRGERLLATIRSRSLPLRFAPLPDDVVRSILRSRGVPEAAHDLAVELAAGSASAALDLADAEANAARDAFIAKVLAAAAARDLGAAVVLAESVDKDKAELKSDLRALGAHIARTARGEVARGAPGAASWARRYDAVSRALSSLDRNGSPSLTVIELVAELRAARVPPAA
jgi:DNA polymerase-3 subunit delta'